MQMWQPLEVCTGWAQRAGLNFSRMARGLASTRTGWNGPN